LPGRRHFLKIEIGQSPDFPDRHNQLATMPAANDRHRDLQEFRQHRRCVEPHVRFVVKHTQSLPELGFRNDLQLTFRRLLANRLVQEADFVQRQFVRANHDQIHIGAQRIDRCPAVIADQILRLSFRHAT
jgi:hypothetical protein